MHRFRSAVILTFVVLFADLPPTLTIAQAGDGGATAGEAPAADGATLDAELAAAIRAAVGEYFGSAPQGGQDEAIACMAALVAPLDAAAKQELVYYNMGGTGDVPLTEAYRAGLGAEIWACIPEQGSATAPPNARQ